MALGNDLDSKIVEIYQEYLKHQKDEKVENRVYATEEAFRNGLEEVIKLNGIVDKGEFYTAIAFEIQNGNFSISSDGKIDLTSESITKAVEKAKEAENKKIKINTTNEEESKKIPTEKGILGIIEIKTMDDARKVLSARIKTEDMTPEKAKLTKDALALSFKEVMSENEATETAAEVVEMATAPEDVTTEIVTRLILPDMKLKKEDLDFIIAFSNTDYVKNNVNGMDNRVYASFSFLLQLQQDLPPNLVGQIKQSITAYTKRNLTGKADEMSWLLFAKSGDEYHFSYVDQLILKMKELDKNNILTEENVEGVVNGIIEDMEAEGITITPEMREEAKKIIANPTMVTKLADVRTSRRDEWAEVEGKAPSTFKVFNDNCRSGIDWEKQYREYVALLTSGRYELNIPSGTTEQIRIDKMIRTSFVLEQGDETLDSSLPKMDTLSKYKEILKRTDARILRENIDATGFTESLPKIPLDVVLSEFMKNSYKEYVDITSGKKVPRTVEEDSDIGIFVDKAFNLQSVKGKSGVISDTLDAEFEASLGKIGDGGDDMFDAMFAGMAEELSFGGSIEVEHDHDVEGDGEMVEDAPIAAGTVLSRLVAEEVVVDEITSKVNETMVPPVTNGPEVIEEPKAPEVPEQGNAQSNLPKVITFADKIKQGLADLGKKAKKVFGKIAGLFGGGSNDTGNNTGTTGTGGIVQDTKPPKPSQSPAYDPLKQQFKLNFDYVKNASTEKGSDPSKGVDDSTQGHEIDDI